MNRRPLEEQYKDHINEVKRQLENAERQVKRIPRLKEVSQYSFEEWCRLVGYPVEQTKENQA